MAARKLRSADFRRSGLEDCRPFYSTGKSPGPAPHAATYSDHDHHGIACAALHPHIHTDASSIADPVSIQHADPQQYTRANADQTSDKDTNPNADTDGFPNAVANRYILAVSNINNHHNTLPHFHAAPN